MRIVEPALYTPQKGMPAQLVHVWVCRMGILRAASFLFLLCTFLLGDTGILFVLFIAVVSHAEFVIFVAVVLFLL